MNNQMLGKKRNSPYQYYEGSGAKEQVKKEDGELRNIQENQKQEHSSSRRRREGVKNSQSPPKENREISNKNQYYQKARNQMRGAEEIEKGYNSDEEERKRRPYRNDREESNNLNHERPRENRDNRQNREKYYDINQHDSRSRSKYERPDFRDSERPEDRNNSRRKNYNNENARNHERQQFLNMDRNMNRNNQRMHRERDFHEDHQQYRRRDHQEMNFRDQDRGKYVKSMSSSSSSSFPKSRSMSPNYNRNKRSDSPRNKRITTSQSQDRSGRRKSSSQPKKRFNFLICLPKNYQRCLDQNFNSIHKEVRAKVRDIKIFDCEYTVQGFQDFVLRIEASRVTSNAQATKIFCDYLFRQMKQTYRHMTYIKVSVLVPAHVVGFIIGIDGKNINKIRDMSGARIDVFQQDINRKYRQIELAGTPLDISRATEKIYKIVNKYFYFNNEGNDHNERTEHYMDKDRDREKRSRRTDDRHRRRDDDKKGRIRLIKKHRKEESKVEDNQIKNSPKIIENPVVDIEQKEKVLETTENLINSNIPINNDISELKKVEANFQQNSLNFENVQSQDTISIDVIIPNQSLSLLKKFQSNIYIDMENKFHCSINKRVEKLSGNSTEVNIINFTGTPQQNTLALYFLQQHILDLEKKGK